MANREIEAILKVSAKLGNLRALSTLQRQLKQVKDTTDAVNRRALAYNRTNSLMARGLDKTSMMMMRVAGPLAATYATTKAVRAYADVEKRITQIGITADATEAQTSAAMGRLRNVTAELHAPFDDVAEGLDSLVASGKSLDEAMAFLPSVGKAAVASGADIKDMATTADATATSLGITADGMQHAFDILAFAGKAGKFELKDMASELPGLLPAFAALGYRGEDGLSKIAVMLQAVRKETGSSEEAATALQNVFQKMYSAETEQKFKKFGIDLRKRLSDAKDEGKDLLDTFVDLSMEAVHGDMSQLPRLFTDAQFLQGMRALINQGEYMRGMLGDIGNAAGTVERDFQRMSKTTAAAMTDLSNSYEGMMQSLGKAAVDVGGADLMKYISDSIEYATSVNAGLEQSGIHGGLARSWWGLWHDQGEKDAMAWLGGFRSQHDRDLADAYRQYGEGKPKPTIDGEAVSHRKGWESADPLNLPSRAPIPGYRGQSIILLAPPKDGEVPDWADIPTPTPRNELDAEMWRQERSKAERDFPVDVSRDMEVDRAWSRSPTRQSSADYTPEWAPSPPALTQRDYRPEWLDDVGSELKTSGETAGRSIEDGGTSAGSAMQDGATAMQSASEALQAVANRLQSIAASIPSSININTTSGGLPPASGNKGQTMVNAGRNRGEL